MRAYWYLMRLDKPIGLFLLLWPTLWALWLAGNGRPNMGVVLVFMLGVILMRSAGCIVNDFADRHVDKYVERTKDRPLASGKITPRAALILFFVLMFAAFLLVLLLNRLTIELAFVGAGLAIFYPFMKRFTHLPQFGLGLAFAWGIPMAFSALTNEVSANAWVLFFAGALWPVIYDTMYAMVDRADDKVVGIKSTAILFGRYDRIVIGVLQVIFLGLLLQVGKRFQLNQYYFVSVGVAFILFLYQQWLIRDSDNRENCFKAFLNNHWVGMAIFIGIILSYEF